MFPNPFQLSEVHAQALRDHLARHQARCAVCNADLWEPDAYVVLPGGTDGRPLTAEDPLSILFATVECVRCGNTLFFRVRFVDDLEPL